MSENFMRKEKSKSIKIKGIWFWHMDIMSKVNNVVEENIFVRYIVILSGMIISSIGINGFIRPAHLLSGGVTGLATMLN